MGGTGKRQHKGHGFLGRDQICFLQEEAVPEGRGGVRILGLEGVNRETPNPGLHPYFPEK